MCAIVTEAQALLTKLSGFNTLTRSDLLGGLTALINLSSKQPREFSHLLSAATLCWRAEHYNLKQDPLIEEWASWPARHNWLNLELKAAISVDPENNGARPLSAELHSLRSKYLDDGEGYPMDIWETYTAHRLRDNLTQNRVEMYRLGALAERSESEESRTYQELLRASCSTEPPPYAALIDKRSDVMQEFYDKVVISFFDAHHPVSMHLWEDLERAQAAFRAISTKFPVFEIEELKKLYEEERFDIASIRYKGRFITAGLVINDNSAFLPQTLAKLAQYGEVALSNLHVHSWQFLNVANPETLLSFRHLAIDWSLLLRDVIRDISVFRGKEDVLGIVELDNHALKSHRRLGFGTFGEKVLFKSDAGNPAIMLRRSLYNPFSE